MTHYPADRPLAEDACMTCGAPDQYDDCPCDPDCYGAGHCLECCPHSRVEVVEPTDAGDVEGADLLMVDGEPVGTVVHDRGAHPVATVRVGASYRRVEAPDLNRLAGAVLEALADAPPAWLVLIDPDRFAGAPMTERIGTADEEPAGSGETPADALAATTDLFRESGHRLDAPLTAGTPGVRVVQITRSSYDALADDPQAWVEVAS